MQGKTAREVEKTGGWRAGNESLGSINPGVGGGYREDKTASCRKEAESLQSVTSLLSDGLPDTVARETTGQTNN
jgi:hypothetical protein